MLGPRLWRPRRSRSRECGCIAGGSGFRSPAHTAHSTRMATSAFFGAKERKHGGMSCARTPRTDSVRGQLQRGCAAAPRARVPCAGAGARTRRWPAPTSTRSSAVVRKAPSKGTLQQAASNKPTLLITAHGWLWPVQASLASRSSSCWGPAAAGLRRRPRRRRSASTGWTLRTRASSWHGRRASWPGPT